MKKRNPVLMVLITAAVLGAVFFGILLFTAVVSGKRAQLLYPWWGAVAWRS